MKIGLLTIHNTQNYGSLLQTYSTYKALDKLGWDIDLIDYRNDAITEREKPSNLTDSISIKQIIKYFIWGNAQKRKYNSIMQFLRDNTSMSLEYNKTSIKNANKEYDGFIVGSDIVWGTNITGGDMTYFLDFASDDKQRYSFSSSIGTKWTSNENDMIKPLLQKFKKISVREDLASEWIEELIGKKPMVTCDPTVLWKPSFWEKFVLDGYAPKRKYVLIYAVNPDKKNIIDGIEYAKKRGMPAYFINFYTPVKGTKTIRPTNVNEWITLFANADTVFSASYHGLLFSLYFKKNVFFYNRGEKSRMISLSQSLNIEDREGNAENIEKDNPIDYVTVWGKLEQMREESWKVLKLMFH